MESEEKRIKRMELATNLIVSHPVSSSFSDLIEPNLSQFAEFKLLYATDNINSNFGGIYLSEIEESCPAITRFFNASGLLFYDDELYEANTKHESVAFPLEYSVSFDTQVAEAFRIYEGGKSVSDWDWFYQLVMLVKGREDNSFNFDYTFYMIEDLVHTLDLSNMRPFETVRALKRFDYLDIGSFRNNPKKPVFNIDRIQSGRKAAEAISSFQNSKEIQDSLARRKGLKLILMKGMQLRWLDKKDYIKNLEKLVTYTIDHLGRFAKLELYFAWKLMKHGEEYRFFGHLMQKSKKAIEKLSGMSWDLYSLRHQETMASKSYKARFYVPFIASFDRRFKELIEACPIRCMLVDERDKRISLIFFDDSEFFQDINKAITDSDRNRLSDPQEKLKRLKNPVSHAALDEHLNNLEKECCLMI